MPTADHHYFARLSRELMLEGSEELTLEAIVAGAVAVVPGCDHAGISLRRRRGRVVTVAATDPLVGTCDDLQYELSEGSCLDAIWHGDVYLSNDLEADPRWPVWGPQVAAEGVNSIIALRISDRSDAIGSLNLYGSARGAFDDRALDLATTFGYHATNALVSAKLVAELESSLQSRHQIGMAQGILMTRYDLTVDEAFSVLQRYSSHENVRLRDVAARVVRDQAPPPRTAEPPLPAPEDPVGT